MSTNLQAAAGLRRVPAAAAVLLVALGGMAFAHGPIKKTYREPPPETFAPSGPAFTAADLAARPPAPAARPLRVIGAEASAVVTADVTRTEVFDEGRLHLYRLHVLRVLRGRVDAPEPGIVDIRADPNAKALLDDGTEVVVLLHPAPAYSYLAEHLPAGLATFTVVAGRDGIVPVGGAGERDAIEQALADGFAIGTMGEAEALAARRRLAFTELKATNPRLLADGVAELRQLPALAPLSTDEAASLHKILADPRVDPRARIALLEAVGASGTKEAASVLAGAAADTPAVLDALFAARARLGTPPTRTELAPMLDADDAGIRAAAIRALARLDDPGALDAVARYATTDRDVKVRAAAVDALGETGHDAAVPILKRTFQDPSKDIVQRSARALIAIGGRQADDALTDVALHGGSIEAQKYAALILVLMHGRDDPVVQHLVASNPSPDVRYVLEHPLQFNHMHVHD